MQLDKTLQNLDTDNRIGEYVYFINEIKSQPWHQAQMHYHPCYEMIICVEGENVVVCCENKVYDIIPGDVLIFSPYTLHSVSSKISPNYRRYVSYFQKQHLTNFSPFSNELFKNFKGIFTHIHLNKAEMQDIYTIMDFSTKTTDHNYLEQIRTISKLFDIIFFLSEKAMSAKVQYHDNYSDINNILLYIDSNIDNANLTLELIAKHFFTTSTTINSRIKNYTGHTTKQYIILKRITKSQELLRHNYSVSDCCNLSGFNNYSHFIRTFTKYVGMSPKQYAKKFCNN